MVTRNYQNEGMRMEINGIYGTVNLSDYIPLWAWNGYNSQWVEPALTREEAISQAFAELKLHGETCNASVIEDADDVTIVVHNSYDFYGRRESVTIYTTRKGTVRRDEVDDNAYDYYPAN
jgi:hypothetical protein